MLRLIGLLTLFFAVPVWADVYKYIDSEGRVYYTDEPKSNLYKRIIKTRPKNYDKALPFASVNKQKYHELVAKAASEHQVDEKLLHAVIQAESAYDAAAVSSAGAVGLMQLMPDTAKRYGVIDRRDPDQNINGGTRYLKDLLTMFNSNLNLAVAAYNAGEHAVIRHGNTIPPYPETQNYVKQVLSLYHHS
ncbi:MAG: lytic transglycosylase [Methylobacter sp.]|nr:MAG: lytic transglycosylase [Methylobacter sp.]PPD20009.1 MAG: lytic transglycosylase [Methylobacter sp.]PPD37400.1 MAG: lytic transglycosylase [Methylomonas sp.]